MQNLADLNEALAKNVKMPTASNGYPAPPDWTTWMATLGFGHLHGAGGSTAKGHKPFQVVYHNVAAVDEAYKVVRGCAEFEI
jgi:hypothetical protein